MRLTGKFKLPRIDISRYKMALHEKLCEALAQAASKFLYTVDEIVPTWSGASRATLSPLASYVGYVLTLYSVSGAPNRIDIGIQHGDATFDADGERGRYSFSYATTLPWLIVNEYYNANTFINPRTGKPYFHLLQPGPYHFQQATTRVLQDYLAHELEGLPDLRAFITITTVSMG